MYTTHFVKEINQRTAPKTFTQMTLQSTRHCQPSAWELLESHLGSVTPLAHWAPNAAAPKLSPVPQGQFLHMPMDGSQATHLCKHLQELSQLLLHKQKWGFLVLCLFFSFKWDRCPQSSKEPKLSKFSSPGFSVTDGPHSNGGLQRADWSQDAATWTCFSC